MNPVRIFISSPGDVEEERQRAVQIVQQLRRRYAGQLSLETVRWEDLPLQPDQSFQAQINALLTSKSIDIAIFILWSRLGSPQGGTSHRPDGRPYRSGTERELDLMLEARRQSGGTHPDLLVYTRQDEASFEERLRGKSTDEKKKELNQKEAVESFITEEFQDAERGVNLRAFHSFDRPQTFSERLRLHLQSLLDDRVGGLSGDPLWDLEEDGPPFLGLEAFQPRHAPVFFGREDEILETRRALRRRALEGCAFVMIAGASGSGKSSLARAGVLPEIIANETDDTISHWVSLILNPGQLGKDPFNGFATRLAEVLPKLCEDAHLASDLAKDAELTVRRSILPALDEHREAGRKSTPGAKPRLLLLIDQLEEMLSSWRSEDDQRAFAALIEAMARSGRIWVLTTLRADFLGEVQKVPPLVRLRADGGQIDLLPPEAPAIARLITDPACLAGLRFEHKEDKSLADRIVADATGHAELLPLTGHLLADLYHHRTAENELTFDRYEEIGGVAGALASHADSVLQSLDEQTRHATGRMLQRLVTVSGEDENSFVRQYPPIEAFTGEEARLLNAFIEGRLVIATSNETVTLAHEVLLRAWLPARSWVEANIDFLRVRARIVSRMNEGSPLLTGDPLLESAKAALNSHREGFDASQCEWITRAVAAADKKEQKAKRMRRTAFITLSLLTLAAIVGAVWAAMSEKAALEAKRQAEEEKERALASEENEKIARKASSQFISKQIDLYSQLNMYGKIELLESLSEASMDYLDAFQEIEPTPDIVVAQIEALLMRSDVLDSLGKKDDALDAARQAFEIIEANPNIVDQELKIYAYTRIGSIYSLRGEYDKALPYYQEYYRLIQQTSPGDLKKNDIGLKDILDFITRLSQTHLGLEEYEKAGKLANEAYNLVPKDDGHRWARAGATYHVIISALFLGDLKLANEKAKERLDYYQYLERRGWVKWQADEEANIPEGDGPHWAGAKKLGRTYWLIGTVNLFSGNYNRSQFYMSRYKEIFKLILEKNPRNKINLVDYINAHLWHAFSFDFKDSQDLKSSIKILEELREVIKDNEGWRGKDGGLGLEAMMAIEYVNQLSKVLQKASKDPGHSSSMIAYQELMPLSKKASMFFSENNTRIMLSLSTEVLKRLSEIQTKKERTPHE